MPFPFVEELSSCLMLGNLLERVKQRLGSYELVDHWQQGEFHHDIVVRVPVRDELLPGGILIVATNCNGGVKEVLCFDTPPGRWALWSWRCPDNSDFAGELPPLLARSTTSHWFDPCELLIPDARSEMRAEFRERQRGGGWQITASACGKR